MKRASDGSVAKRASMRTSFVPRAAAGRTVSSGEIQQENFRSIDRAQLQKVLLADSSAIARLQGYPIQHHFAARYL